MTKKEAIVKYILEMNTDMLSLVLENDISFMNLYKEDFLRKLDEIFIECRKDNFYKFSNVIPGISEDDETNGLEGFKFITSDKRALILLFEEANGDIIDIYNCTKFKTYQNCEEVEPMYISVYDDEKISYMPTFEHIALTNKIESFYAQFEEFKNTVTLVEDYENWFKTVKDLYDTINIIAHMEFKFFYDFSNFVVDNLFALFIVEIGEISQKALKEYENLDISNEFELLEWLLKYEDVGSISSDQLEKVDNWEEKSLIKHKTERSIILDCSNYRSSFKFEEIYNKHYNEQKMNGIKI